MTDEWRVHMTRKGQHQVFDASFLIAISLEERKHLPNVQRIHIEPGTYMEYVHELAQDVALGRKTWSNR